MSRETSAAPASRTRVILALSSLCVGLLAAVVVLVIHPVRESKKPLDRQEALRDPEVRARVIRDLLKANPAFFDSHPDAAVARVMIPNLQGVEFYNALVSTNEWGMRERSYALPKPADTLRVVLLGDSYVFGNGAPAEDRLGVFLEAELTARAGPQFHKRIEVLHIGIGSWNTIAECAFVRRQLSELLPDLVVQLYIYNDLDDNAGVRGFGVRSDFAPLHPERANSMVQADHPQFVLGEKVLNGLVLGSDYEGQSRIQASAEAVGSLARAIERCGGEYLFLACVGPWMFHPLQPLLEQELDPEQIAVVDFDQMMSRAYQVSDSDAHWNRAGHERAATLVYGLIQERGFLAELAANPWAEASLLANEGQEERLADARQKVRSPTPVSSRLEANAQVCGGLDKERNASPYVSVSLSPKKSRVLAVTARCFERPEIDGGTVQVFVDEVQVGGFRLAAGERIEASFDVPLEQARRDTVSVRLLADDWVYTGSERRICLSYVLESLEFTR